VISGGSAASSQEDDERPRLKAPGHVVPPETLIRSEPAKSE